MTVLFIRFYLADNRKNIINPGIVIARQPPNWFQCIQINASISIDIIIYMDNGIASSFHKMRNSSQ